MEEHLAKRVAVSPTRLVAPNYARKDFSLNLVLPVPESLFPQLVPIPLLPPKAQVPKMRRCRRTSGENSPISRRTPSQSLPQGRCLHGNVLVLGTAILSPSTELAKAPQIYICLIQGSVEIITKAFYSIADRPEFDLFVGALYLCLYLHQIVFKGSHARPFCC